MERGQPGLLEAPLTKRGFLKACAVGLCALSLPSFRIPGGTAEAQTFRKGLVRRRPSPYFTPLGWGDVRCDLCPAGCRLSPGGRGLCRVRENRDGRLYTLVYGNPCAVHPDPIEKTPFFHVLPGATTLSIATAGCNFRCKFCQNWEFSQASPEEVYGYDFPPERVAAKALEMGVRCVSYTYVEPTVFFEYMADVARLAMGAGLLNVLHSNGYINPGPLRELCGLLDAAHIDLKGFTEGFYRELCGGRLSPVLETLRTLRREGVHLEITNLVIPTRNEDPAGIRRMCLWVREELGADTPLHFTRFYPLYRLTKLPPTPVSLLERAREEALSAGLRYVYIGNVPGHPAWNTYCPECGRPVILRTGYVIREMRLNGGHCAHCGSPVPGIWA